MGNSNKTTTIKTCSPKLLSHLSSQPLPTASERKMAHPLFIAPQLALYTTVILEILIATTTAQPIAALCMLLKAIIARASMEPLAKLSQNVQKALSAQQILVWCISQELRALASMSRSSSRASTTRPFTHADLSEMRQLHHVIKLETWLIVDNHSNNKK